MIIAQDLKPSLADRKSAKTSRHVLKRGRRDGNVRVCEIGERYPTTAQSDHARSGRAARPRDQYSKADNA